MNFIPLSDEELAKQRGQLLPGSADFEILYAEESVSKQGNPMIKLQLKVWDSEGKQGLIFDYITNNAQWKIRQLLESVERIDLYGTGELAASQLEGRTGKATIYLQKDKSGKYEDSMKIKDYLSESSADPKAVELAESLGATLLPSQKPGDDDIPF